ncbi:MAG TPA: tol-pal system protein YbgF [Nitrobacter sp.]|nr:tol-pal system protein YbgF [Nitrobacter sp.]
MSSPFPMLVRIAVVAAGLALPSQVFAQSYGDADPEVRIQQLEEQLRNLTGQNEELQHRNQMLEQQLRQGQGSAPPAVNANVNAGPPPAPPPAPMQLEPNQGYGGSPYPPQQGGYQQPGYRQQPAPIVQDDAGAASGRRGRDDAFNPALHPNAPGVPRALGGGRMPIESGSGAGAPGGYNANLANTGQGAPMGMAPPPPANDGLTTLPPSASPRDEFDLGIGYMQRKDYALAEETMRNFTRKYPSDALTGDAQYWLGESLYQRQKYRDAAEAFLGVTTKYDTSAKAPDSLLRLGQSLAALKEKEAACAALGEVARKYPRASAGVKQAVEREQKRVKC